MTTKQDKKQVAFVNASYLIKKEQRLQDFYIVDATSFDDCESYTLEDATLIAAQEIIYKHLDEYPFKDDLRVIKLAKRLGREFLRKEGKQKKLEVGKNEALLKVSVIDLKEEIECIEEIRMHVDNPKLLNIRDELDEWIFNTQPFNGVGLYTIKAKVEEVDCELYSSYMWDFEIIDFKPLEK